ncbi:putative leucine-rich repeat domain superfamily [Helianthus annuus]|nr:putative leucine-rich repeat domain superfamily [Helianthus annuus]
MKTLTLCDCRLPWSEMSIIKLFPNLELLKLTSDAFVGSRWNTDEQEFPQLKFLSLHWLNIKVWDANNRSFRCLRKLEISSCFYIEEIPLEIGDIPTLKLISIDGCRPSVGESVRRIQEEQHDLGNYDLKIYIQEEWQ